MSIKKGALPRHLYNKAYLFPIVFWVFMKQPGIFPEGNKHAVKEYPEDLPYSGFTGTQISTVKVGGFSSVCSSG